MIKKITVVIADDHLLFAQALEDLINTFCNFEVMYHVSNGQELIKKLENKEHIPDIALIDIQMQEMDGIKLTKWLKKNTPSVNVIGLSMSDDEDTITKMLKAGAKSYLTKDITSAILKDAFKNVIENGFFYSSCITPSILGSLRRKKDLDFELKDREIEFLKLACTEKTYKEIAHEMLLSPKTIDGYRETLFEKLKIKSRVGLVIFAIKNKICHLNN